MARQPALTYMMTAQQKRNALSLALANPYLARGFINQVDMSDKAMDQDEQIQARSPITITPVDDENESEDNEPINTETSRDASERLSPVHKDNSTADNEHKPDYKSELLCSKPENCATNKPVIKFSIDDILGRKNPVSSPSLVTFPAPRMLTPGAPLSIPASFLGHLPPQPRGMLQKQDEDLIDEEEIDVDSEDGLKVESGFCGSEDDQHKDQPENYSWLQCTRYKPPKLPRSKKKEGVKKRKLGRNPRVPFTQHQVSILEQKFRQTHYLSSVDVAELSAALNLTETRVKIWFQNRRARERRDKDSTALSPTDGGDSRSSPPVGLSPTEANKSSPPTVPPHPIYFNPIWPLAGSYPFDARAAFTNHQGMIAPNNGNTRQSAFTPVTFRRYV